MNEFEKNYHEDDSSPFCGLFTGFPNVSKSGIGFSIEVDGEISSNLKKAEVSIDWFYRKTDEDRQTITLELASKGAGEDAETFPALVFNTTWKRKIYPLDRIQRNIMSRIDVDSPSTPCVYVDPFSSRSISQMGILWDAIALTDNEAHVVESLKVICPEILAVSMIGSGERGMRARTTIAKSSSFPSPLPLRTFGDGVNRLFGIVLSLCNLKNPLIF